MFNEYDVCDYIYINFPLIDGNQGTWMGVNKTYDINKMYKIIKTYYPIIECEGIDTAFTNYWIKSIIPHKKVMFNKELEIILNEKL